MRTRRPFRQTWTAIRALLILTVVLGIGYPAVVLGVGQLALPAQANGSLVRVDGEVVGSSLIGQSFTTRRRPSGSSPARRPPATGTTAPHRPAPTTDPRTRT